MALGVDWKNATTNAFNGKSPTKKTDAGELDHRTKFY